MTVKRIDGIHVDGSRHARLARRVPRDVIWKTDGLTLMIANRAVPINGHVTETIGPVADLGRIVKPETMSLCNLRTDETESVLLVVRERHPRRLTQIHVMILMTVSRIAARVEVTATLCVWITQHQRPDTRVRVPAVGMIRRVCVWM